MRARGFTLLEVLIALAIIAIGLAAAIRIAGSNGANAAYLRDKTFAEWVAANKATELRLQRTWPSVGTTTGHETLDGREWAWSAKVSDTFDNRIRRVDVKAGPDSDHLVVTLSAFLPQVP